MTNRYVYIVVEHDCCGSDVVDVFFSKAQAEEEYPASAYEIQEWRVTEDDR